MLISFLYQRLNKATNVLEEQYEFTNDAALRAFLRLQARSYLNDNDHQLDKFDDFLKYTYADQYSAAIKELANGEAVNVPSTFVTDTHIFILNVILKCDMAAS